MEPSAIIFDVDGTLIDTYRLYLESYRRALVPFLGHAPGDEEIVDQHPGSEREFLRRWLGVERGDECHADFCRHYAELHATLVEGLYEGVREMLAALRSAGIPLGVVTGKGRRGWEVTTRDLDLGEFEVVVTEDDTEHPKPDPTGLRMAAAAMGIEPSSAVYVGDSLVDVQAARGAGMRVAAALWPKTAPGERDAFLQRIAHLAPDWTPDRPADLSRIFAGWC